MDGTCCPQTTLPMRWARTNLISPLLTFLSSFMAAKSFVRWLVFNFNSVGRPARWKRLAMRADSFSGSPVSACESFAAATCPIEMASPWRYFP